MPSEFTAFCSDQRFELTCRDPLSGIETALRKHSGGASSSSSATAFSGKGQTLGGGPAPSDVTGNAKRAVDNATAGASAAVGNIDPQIKVFIGLVGLYALFYFLG